MAGSVGCRSSWWIVVGSAVGLIFSTGPLLQFCFGAFILPVSRSLEVDRGAVSLALLLSLGASGLMTPILGRIADRLGVRKVIMPGVACFGLAYASIGLFSAHSLVTFLSCYTMTGAIGAAQTPLLYAKSITSAFDRSRGMALGIAMAGVGVGAAIMPRLAQWLVERLGWQQAYEALGLAAVAIALPAVSLLRVSGHPSLEPAVVDVSGGPSDGSFARYFAKLALTFFLVAVAASGVVAHLIPLMTDRGVVPEAAAATIAGSGGALILGRVLAGYCLDRLFAPKVAAVFFALPLVGIGLLLATSTGIAACIAAVLIGLGLGAEMDLIAFLQSRYLGLVRFGEIYGYMLMIFMLGSGVGPFLMGMSFRFSASYRAALALFVAGLAIACGLMLTLGAYRFGAGRRDAGS